MANYSTDSDLALYVRESGSLPTLTNWHTEAKLVIDRYLHTKGYTDDNIADFGTSTLAQLRVLSSYWVLMTFFAGFVGDPGAEEKARWFEAKYNAEMSALYIDYDDDGESVEDVLSSGDCVLG